MKKAATKMIRKIRAVVHTAMEQAENRWRKLSLRRQQKTILLLFSMYFCLSLVVIFKACISGAHSPIAVDHIENPVISQEQLGTKVDSLTQILKNKFYENK